MGRVAAAHEEPLSDEEAPAVEAADLHDVALHGDEGAPPTSTAAAMFPLHDGGHVVTINVTQYSDTPGGGGVAVAVDVSHGKAAVNESADAEEHSKARLPPSRALTACPRAAGHHAGDTHAGGGRNVKRVARQVHC
jgi:hypothetical protein